jgi:adenosylcobinamide-GDP ribazoletransferase
MQRVSSIRARVAEFRVALMLLTRLPAGRFEGEMPPLSSAVWAYPLVGAIAAIPSAIVFMACADRLPVSIAALLAIIVGLLVTGALHEDGLADFCDGMGGGRTREQRLEIMRDSRIGTYGALGLILSVGLRTMALANMPSAPTGAIALICFGAASRAGLPLIMFLQHPARADGLGASVGRPPLSATIVACILGLVAMAASGAGLTAIAMLAISLIIVCWYCEQKIGGYTGDTLGASQQIAEVACWLAILLAL